MNARRGFTLVETLIALIVVSVLILFVLYAVNSRARLTDARNAERNHHVRQLITAMSNHIYATQSTQDFDSVSFPTGEANRKPLCRQGMVSANCPNADCVNLDVLAVSGQLTELPYDTTEQCACYSGYEVYFGPGDRPFAQATYSGKIPGDAPGSVSCVPCGNGVCAMGETCSACPADCGVCPPACGDGTVDAGEACDDGNTSNADACSATCLITTCGDGFIQNPNGQSVNEVCDDGSNNSDTAACLTTCVAATCGDGNIHAGVETCWNCPADVGACPIVEYAIDRDVNTAPVTQQRTPSVVFVSDTVGYAFYVDRGGRCTYSKTTDGGTSWGGAVNITMQTDCMGVDVWYDQWTPGDAGTSIHILFADNSADDLWYRRLDTNPVAETEAFAFGEVRTSSPTIGPNLSNSIATLNRFSITKATDGKVYIGMADGPVTGPHLYFILRCAGNCDANNSWTEAGPNPLDNTEDDLRLLPLPGGKILLINWDISVGANAIRSKVWDGAAWDANWTPIGNAIYISTYRSVWGATVNKNTNDISLVWNSRAGSSGVASNFKTARYNSATSTWMPATDVATGDYGFSCDIAIDETSGRVYVARIDWTPAGNNILVKYSEDDMASWSADTKVNVSTLNHQSLSLNMMSPFRLFADWYTNTSGFDTLMGTTISDP